MDEIPSIESHNHKLSQLNTIEFICSDGVIIYLSKTDCGRCGTIKTMLANTSTHISDNGKVDNGPIPLIKSSKDMELLIEWFSDDTLPAEVDSMLKLLVVADFLEVEELITSICKKVANIVDQKTLFELKVLFEPITVEELKCTHSLEKRPYDGIDPNLQHNRKVCYNMCENHTPEKLLLCTGCHQMRYCSKNCQKEDWETHKVPCKAIKKALKVMNKERSRLIAEEGDDIFEGDNVGHLWGYVTPRNYCRARLQLADSYLDLAHSEEYAHMYEEGLKHYMELMRLIHSDNMGLRDKTVFILIKLNRDEDCYNFLKWWIAIDPNGRYDWGNPPSSVEGDWLYLKGQDRFEDPSEVCAGQYVSLAFNVAMLIMKLRIVAKHVGKIQQFRTVIEFIRKDESWHMLEGISGSLKTYLVGDKKHFTLMEEQYKHIDFLFKSIESHNAIFLKAVLDPGPLKSQPYPNAYSQGSAEEAWLVLNDSCIIFYRIPGAIMRIRAFFNGADTTYDPSFSKWGI